MPLYTLYIHVHVHVQCASPTCTCTLYMYLCQRDLQLVSLSLCVQVAGLSDERGCQTDGFFLDGGEGWSPTLFIRLIQDYGFDIDVHTCICIFAVYRGGGGRDVHVQMYIHQLMCLSRPGMHEPAQGTHRSGLLQWFSGALMCLFSDIMMCLWQGRALLVQT